MASGESAAINDQLALSRDEAIKRMRRTARSERRWTLATLYAGLFFVVGIFVGSYVVQLFGFTHPNALHFDAILQPPSWSHPFGTDDLGRDVFTRVAYGSHVDYEVAFLATAGALLIGVTLGAIAGYVGGLTDRVIMRLADIILAFPYLIFVIAFVAIFGVGVEGIYVGLIAFGWAMFARLTRAALLVLRELPYIRVAETLGLTRFASSWFTRFRTSCARTLSTRRVSWSKTS